MTSLQPATSLSLEDGLTTRLLPSTDIETRLDLSQTRFVQPCGLVVLICLAESAVNHGRHVTFVPPPYGSNCSKYLYRMGLHGCLNEMNVESDLTTVSSHDTGDRLLELTRFTTEAEAECLAARVFTLARSKVGDLGARRLYVAISEAAVNVIEHADAACGYMALQSYPGRHTAVFAIGDAGCGLRASLARHHAVGTDRDAIAAALRPGVSGTGTLGRGNGLPEMRTQASRGFNVLSGAAHFHQSDRQSWSVVPAGVSYAGTIVAGSIPI